MRKFLKKIYKTKAYKFYILIKSFIRDFKLYVRYSNVFNEINDINKKEAKIILHYHAIEKGFVHNKLRLGFGKERIQSLHKYLNDSAILQNIDRSQIKVAYMVMCQYYEFHLLENFDISEFFSEIQYEFYKEKLNIYYDESFKGTIDFKKESFYSNVNSNFEKFSYSRKSIRNFTGEIIKFKDIQEAVQLALNAPSVCNRQASKVYLLDRKSEIDKVLKIQGGFSGFSENVNQLLVLTNDRNYYYTIGERNQFYIDGGIFLMNLLYALHFYKIACCPANWGKDIRYEKLISKVINIPKSEQIICIIPIGIASENFRVTLSERRKLNEVLSII